MSQGGALSSWDNYTDCYLRPGMYRLLKSQALSVCTCVGGEGEGRGDGANFKALVKL